MATAVGPDGVEGTLMDKHCTTSLSPDVEDSRQTGSDDDAESTLSSSHAEGSQPASAEGRPTDSDSEPSALTRSAVADAAAADAFAEDGTSPDMTKFVEAIRDCKGAVLVSGIGKSGIVGMRMAASLRNMGRRATFVHGTEYAHGDLGVFRPGDCAVSFSYSGETREMVEMMAHCRKQDRDVTLLAVVGKPGSSMESLAHHALVFPPIPEDRGELLGKVPTRSIVMQEMAINAVLTEIVESSGFDQGDALRNRTAPISPQLPEKEPAVLSPVADSAYARSLAADAAAARAFAKGVTEIDITAFTTAIRSCQGMVLCTGMGKSGIVAKRMAAALMSISVPAIHVEGSGWVHGDLGLIQRGDCIVVFSDSGENLEMVDFMTHCRKQDRGATLLAVVGKARFSTFCRSSMEALADSTLLHPNPPELLGVVKTRSVVMQEMVVNAVLTEIVEYTGFDKAAFLRNHPGGSIGVSLAVAMNAK